MARVGAPEQGQDRTRSAALTSSGQYRAAYREGARFVDEILVLYVRRNGLPVNRAGVSVARSAGGAVKRNRLRRRIREACRQLQDLLPSGVDIVIVPRSSAVAAPFGRLTQSLRNLCARAGLIGLQQIMP